MRIYIYVYVYTHIYTYIYTRIYIFRETHFTDTLIFMDIDVDNNVDHVCTN